MLILTRWIAASIGVFCYSWGSVVADAPAKLEFPADKAAIKTEGGPVAGAWNLWSNGQVGQPVRIATAGKYTIVIRAYGSSAGGVWPEMVLLVDGLPTKTFTVESAKPADYRYDVQLTAGTHDIAASFTNDGLIGKEDRNLYLMRFTIEAPPGAIAPTLSDGSERKREAEERERQIVAATADAIEKNRKNDAVIHVVTADGKPLPNVIVGVKQTRQEFLFGANIFGFDQSRDQEQNELYKRRFAEIFNYATVGFYWRWYERERGKPNYATTDRVVAWCLEHGIRMKGHPLLWGDQAGIPPWSNGQPAADVQRQRVHDILTRYQGKIEFFEVVNEPSHLPVGPKIDLAYRWAREIDPKAYLIVNDYHVLADGCPGFFNLLSEANANGVPYDGIGIQAHEPRTARFPLDRVQKILDQYAPLGKELHITEYTPTSAGAKITDSHLDGNWDEATQADYAVKFYRVCFAHPAVRAITWWDLSDQFSWLPGGGMIRKDMSPKPVYEQLKKLIHDDWMTKSTGSTDSEGAFAFRGFRGDYTITVEAGGKKVEKPFTLAKGKLSEGTIQLP